MNDNTLVIQELKKVKERIAMRDVDESDIERINKAIVYIENASLQPAELVSQEEFSKELNGMSVSGEYVTINIFRDPPHNEPEKN